MELNISIYGIGDFGYSFLNHLDHKNDGSLKITAYDYRLERSEFLKKHRRHPQIQPSSKISQDIIFANNPKELIANCDILLLGLPSTATNEVIENINQYAKNPLIIVNTAKSLNTRDGRRLSEIFAENLNDSRHSYCLIAGGTIAKDLFEHEPLGADIVCADEEVLSTVKQVFESSHLRIYPTNDMAGVEYASALKNIISIFAGIVSGLGFSYGSETHAISRLAQEIADKCVELGARPDTFSMGSQCWGNDMWMSCTGKTRNKMFGVLLGQGKPVDEAREIMAQQNKLVEGINTLKAIENIPEFLHIPSIKLLHDFVISQEVDIKIVKKHILNQK